MELVVAAETETGQLASGGPGPPTKRPRTEGMAKTGVESPKQLLQVTPFPLSYFLTTNSPRMYATSNGVSSDRHTVAKLLHIRLNV